MKESIIPILKRHQVLRASVFGSFATGTNRPDSDLDLIVDLPQGKSYFDLVGLQNDLEDALRRKVDVLTYGHRLHPIVREGILKEQLPLY